MNKVVKYLTEDGKKYKGKRHYHNGRWYTGVTHTEESNPLITQTTIIADDRRNETMPRRKTSI